MTVCQRSSGNNGSAATYRLKTGNDFGMFFE